MLYGTGTCHSLLKEFLLNNLPKVKDGKKAKFHLGVSNADFAGAIKEVCVKRDKFMLMSENTLFMTFCFPSWRLLGHFSPHGSQRYR